MDKTDTGVELRIACQAFFESGHSDQNHANFPCIEDGPNLFETGHSEAVCLINQNERRRVTDLHVLVDVLFGNLTVGRMEFWKWFGQPVVFVQKLCLVLFISPLNGF
jgi:hypothetical protein